MNLMNFLKNNSILLFGIVLLIIGIFSTAYIHSAPEKNKSITEENAENKDIRENSENIQEEKIQFVLYFDFACPHCMTFFKETYLPLKEKYSENIDFRIVPYSQKTVGKSFIFAKYLHCINKTDPAKTDLFIETFSMNDDINDEEKRKILGLNIEENKSFSQCTADEDASNEAEVIEMRQNAQQKNVRGTPTFFINTKKFERNQSYKKVDQYLQSTFSLSHLTQ